MQESIVQGHAGNTIHQTFKINQLQYASELAKGCIGVCNRIINKSTYTRALKFRAFALCLSTFLPTFNDGIHFICFQIISYSDKYHDIEH